MSEYIINFDSTAQALTGEQNLLEAGLKVWVMSKPVDLGAECGFCLRVKDVDLASALKLLGDAELVWQGVYASPGETDKRWRLVDPSLELRAARDGAKSAALAGSAERPSGGNGAQARLDKEEKRGPGEEALGKGGRSNGESGDDVSSSSEWRELVKTIPKVDVVLAEAEKLAPDLAALPKEELREAVRMALAERRRDILEGGGQTPWSPLTAASEVAARLARPSLRRVLNATGVVLHTNLGRSALARKAADNVHKVCSGYANLEYDLEAGCRRSRQSHVENLLVRLFGGEAALAVNNNAAAVLLVSTVLAQGRPIVISRGEMVEIGSSFRLGDILEAGGARLREIGSTNRTVIADYSRALADGQAAMILKVHAGNFRIVGYGESPELSEILAAARAGGVPLVCDLGSGSPFSLSTWLPEEPVAVDYLKMGVDLVTMSGDKLMGAGQAGLIVGAKKYVDLLRGHPLARAVRLDKLNLAALEATLKLALHPALALEAIPTLRMLTVSQEVLKAKAEKLQEQIGSLAHFSSEVVPVDGQTGGGSAPARPLPSWAVALSAEPEASTARLEEDLRLGEVPVVARLSKGRLWLDVRTVDDKELGLLAQSVRTAAKKQVFG
ncbi:MAG: L-seryl-tRNA(Sec) selenium transferase [Deltaproteobacteria bacterium]|jgi:L-seryl-tRNA(Ser) seleniumtransferase|nr:L-seryl-tRNA(Sec) selenium transferase [Deltaproteobacteria bacterium]